MIPDKHDEVPPTGPKTRATAAYHDSSQSSGAASSGCGFLADLIERGVGESKLYPRISEQRGVLREERALDLGEHPTKVRRGERGECRNGRHPRDELGDEAIL